jgi:hypothetical protein
MKSAGILLAAVLAGCASPEAQRIRGGGPGADVGNHGRVVVLHEGAVPYYKTPCVTEVECNGPMPVFAKSRQLD